MKSLKGGFLLLFCIMLISSLGISYTSYKVQQEVELLSLSRDQLYEVTFLAEELKLSSDNLTKFARTYAITGNKKWYHLFQRVLDVREGKAPIPRHSQYDYWDHLASPYTALPEIPKQFYASDIMSRFSLLGLNDFELTQMQNALATSDALVSIEQQAFFAIQGVKQDQFGNWDLKVKPDLEKAQALLFGEQYLIEKSKIMKSIGNAFRAITTRLENDIIEHQNQLDASYEMRNLCLIILIVSILTSFFLLWRFYIKPVAIMQKQVVSNVESGNFNFKLNIRGQGELALFSKTMNKLLGNIAEQLEFNTIMKDFGLALRGRKNPAELGEELLQFLEQRLPVPLLGLYVLEDRSQLKRVAGTGYSPSAPTCYSNYDSIHFHVVSTKKPSSMAFEESQYAIELNGEKLFIREMHYFPLVVSGDSIGLLELGCLRNINESDYKWIKSVINDLAISLQLTQNIDQQLKAEQLITEQLELNKKILDAIPNPMYYKSSSGKFLGVNSSFHQYFGTFDADLIDAKPIDIFTEEVAEAFERSQQKLTSELSNHHYELMIDNVDGDSRDFLVYEAIFTNAENEVSGIVGLLLDVTERKQMETELIEAKEKADEMSTAKGEFLANMSHEIRTPMNAIIGMSHLALKTNLTEQQHGYLTKIDHAAKNLLGIINDILDFSKIESGKLTVENIDFSLQEVIDNVININVVKVEEKNLEMILDVEPDVPMSLIGDPLRLGQILINLCGNAIKFTDKGEIIIAVGIVEQSEDEAVLKFSVKDSGIGMTDDQKSKLFQAFSQADGSITRKYGGTGLGLNISKQLCELMGGSIAVETELDKGSTFFFTIKCGLQTSKLKNVICPESSLLGKTALVVDDNESARAVLGNLLIAMKFKVDFANSGEAAIDQARSAQYDLIFMDWQMPGISGVEAIRTIRKHSSTDEPKYILVTAYGSEIGLNEDIHDTIDALILKPVNASVLLNSIMECFDLKLSVTLPKNSAHSVVSEFNSERVLLVEDNITNQEVANEMLSSVNLHITVANHGQEALDLLKNDKQGFQMVLMDMQMPIMDGLTATQKIRNELNLKELPIIAMTANAMQEDIDKCKDAGMNDHISKPINFELMISVINQYLSQSLTSNEHLENDSIMSAQSDNKPLLLQEVDEEVLPNHEKQYYEKSSRSNLCLKTLKEHGVNAHQGIKRLGGNEKAYCRILTKFVNNQIEETINLNQALMIGDMEHAKRIAHSLKGSAANLCLEGLSKQAAEFEDMIGAEQEVNQEQIQEVTEQLRQLGKYLNSITIQPESNGTGEHNEPESSKSPKEVSDQDKEHQLLALLNMLKSGDASSIDKVKELEQLNLFNHIQGERLIELIEDFEFELAQDTLNTMLSSSDETMRDPLH